MSQSATTTTTSQADSAQPVQVLHDQNAQGKSQQDAKEAHQAAQLIQRNYRGYRTRRELKGHGLNASSRWHETIQEAQFRYATKPLLHDRPRPTSAGSNTSEKRSRARSDAARKEWKRAGEIIRRAGADDPSDSDSVASRDLTEEQREQRHRRKTEARHEREKTAKMMDLQYFLEMVDSKHRYGSNLRTYHQEWKNSDTHQPFFYWLDHGDGKDIELPTVSREKLEQEQVRYLTREERYKYLVKIDHEGRLCWAKNGQRISTTVEWKDSLDGIIPQTDNTTPQYQQDDQHHKAHRRKSTDSSSTSSSSSSDSAEGDHYVNHDLDKAKGVKKIQHVSASAVLNHLLRGTVKPNTWIFVADTSFRLYVGIKQSGAFQHSSFLQGARISAAGTLKIKDGQLRRLSPLSGHYRAPTANFKTFVHSLRDDAGADMSRVSISRSVTVLAGLEAYVRTRRKLKTTAHRAEHRADKLVRPQVAAAREQDARDNSESAEKERRVLAAEAERAEKVHRELSFRHRFLRKIGVEAEGERDSNAGEKSGKSRQGKRRSWLLSRQGLDVESGPPPSGGKR